MQDLDENGPFDPASDDVNADHPLTDSNVEPEEAYDEGIAGAAEIQEPTNNDSVESYNPDNDQRLKDTSD